MRMFRLHVLLLRNSDQRRFGRRVIDEDIGQNFFFNHVTLCTAFLKSLFCDVRGPLSCKLALRSSDTRGTGVFLSLHLFLVDCEKDGKK